MLVEIFVSENSDGAEANRMLIDGKEVCSVYPLYECPEDAIIGRDLISCREIYALMERAYNAGRAGDELTCTIKEEEW